MSKQASKRTANDTASREEVTAETAALSAVVSAFLASAKARSALTLSEASAYVAAVDSVGKRGAAAKVQRAIAAGLSEEGFDAMSAPRYSKMEAAYRALSGLGIDVTPEAWEVVYGLWNVNGTDLPAATRDGIVASAKRRKPANRLPYLTAELAAARKGERRTTEEDTEETGSEETGSETAPDVTPDTEETAAPVPTAADILDGIRALWEAAATHIASDADRITIADTFRAAADSLTASVVPSDASTLTDAA